MDKTIKAFEITSKQGEPKVQHIYPRNRNNKNKLIIEKLMTLAEIVDKYSEDLSEEETKELKNYGKI